jgi:NAD(P)H-dependent FMN reductase
MRALLWRSSCWVVMEMKAVVVSFVPPDHAPLAAVAEVLDDELARAGYETVEHFALQGLKLGYCQGEFDCWVKTPGLCKIHDAEQQITRAVAGADAVVLLGPVQFGGFAHVQKRALDRLICLITPFFEKRHALTHHESRYQHYPRLYAVGWLPEPDPDQQLTFEALNDANAINLFAPLRGTAVLDGEHAEFYTRELRRMLENAIEPGSTLLGRDAVRSELLDAARPEAFGPPLPPKTAALLVGSAKPKGTSASARIASAFERRFVARGIECRLHYATEFVHDGVDALASARSIARADLFLLATPLYVDALPALATHALELIANARRSEGADAVFVPFVNCGFPEPEHIRTALRIARHFAHAGRYRFGGGLPLGGGGVVTAERSLDEERPPVAHVVRAIALAAAALSSGEPVPGPALEALLHAPLPDQLYRFMGDLGFRWQAHALGTSQRELRARPFE